MHITLCWFSIAAVNNYHKISGLSNMNLLSSRVQKSEMCPWAKVKVSKELCSFLQALGENLFFCLFQFLEVALIPWLIATFDLQSQQRPVKSSSNPITLTLTLLPSSSALKDLSNHIGPTWIIQNSLSFFFFCYSS